MPNKVSLYANVGSELTHYDVDVEDATLTRRGTVGLPANVQYVWPHASRRFLYVATSDSASGMGPAGNTHHVTALRIDPAAGALSPHGAPIRLPTRPIHMATDIPSQFILVAFNNPSAHPRLSDQSQMRRRATRLHSLDRSIPASSPIRCARRWTTAR